MKDGHLRRTSHFWIGLMMLVLNLGVAFLVIRGDPEDLGVVPYGRQEESVNLPSLGDSRNSSQRTDIGLREAMRTSSLWLLVLFMFICGSGDFLVTTHLIPMVADYGIPAQTAGNMLAGLGQIGFLRGAF